MRKLSLVCWLFFASLACSGSAQVQSADETGKEQQQVTGKSEKTVPLEAPQQQQQQQQPLQEPNSLVINSLDEGLFEQTGGPKQLERLHYEQQAAATGSQQLNQINEQQLVDEAPALVALKPEPRNQLDEPAQDPVILDHRPTGGVVAPASDQQQQPQQQQAPAQQDAGQQQQQQSFPAPTTPTQVNQATTTPVPVAATQAPLHGANLVAAPATTPASIMQQQQQQQGGWYPTAPIPAPQQAAPVASIARQSAPQGAYAANSQQVAPQQQALQQQQQQHPGSINAIISEQQAMPNGYVGQQPQMLPSGAQQQPIYLMAGNQQLNPGRRISSWLKGISSMLANIFNRREHALLSQASTASGQLMAPPATPSSGFGWMQLGGGGGAPHWLSTAQSAIQQQQHQFQQFNSQASKLLAGPNNRYAQQYNQMGVAQQLPPSAATVMSGQPAPLQAPLTQSYAANPQQQQPQQAHPADLQASASQANYAVAVQAPAPAQFAAQSSPQQQYAPAQQQPAQVAHKQQQVTPAAPQSQATPLPQAGQQQFHSTQATPTAADQPWLQQQQQQQQQAASSQAGSQQRAPTTTRSSDHANLPLAHYSRYHSASAD